MTGAASSRSLSPPVLAIGSVAMAIANGARFGQDEIPFVVYKTPTIKSIAPIAGLICGLSPIDMIVQGLDGKATMTMKSVHKARFKRRGQMQVSDIQLYGDGKMLAIVPRFNITSAVATEISHKSIVQTGAASSGGSSPRHGSALAAARRSGPLKLWNRQGAIFVAVLRARNLFVSKKATCNPFVVLHCNKIQLKSTRKDGTFAPVWNEMFDFDWRSLEPDVSSLRLRLSVENQLNVDQSEMLGQVQIGFAEHDFTRAFSVRAWLPLRKPMGKAARNFAISNYRTQELGEIELALAFLPAPVKKAAPMSKMFTAVALKSSLLSAVQQSKHQQQRQQQHQAGVPVESARKKKEKLLRVFRQHGAAPSNIPSEVTVELALNGQDFWSVALSKCSIVPTPIVLNAEPSFICISGGTLLNIAGMNFVATGCIRIAFAVVQATLSSSSSSSPSATATPSTSPSPALLQRTASSAAMTVLDSTRVVVVEAKYRSNSLLSCVTPSLHTIVGLSDTSLIHLYVALNGLDFDSFALPFHSLTIVAPPLLPMDAPVDIVVPETGKLGKIPTPSEIAFVDGRYIVNQRCLLHSIATAQARPPSEVDDTLNLTKGVEMVTGSSGSGSVHAMAPNLHHQLRVYLKPVIFRVRPADGVYTSRLVIEGRDFTATGVSIGKSFCMLVDQSICLPNT